MVIRRFEDIERDKHEEKRDKVVDDINYVVENVFKKPKQNGGIFWFIVKIGIGLVLLVTFINLILANVWLLKFFTKSLF